MKKIKNNFTSFLGAAIAGSIFGIAAAHGAFIDIPESYCGNFPCPEGETGVKQAQNLAASLVNNVRFIIGAVAILMIVVAGVKLIASQGNEEEFKKQTQTVLWGVVGLMVISLAGEIAEIFDVDRGGFLKDPNVMVQRSRLFNKTTEILITFIKYIIGGVAVANIARNSLRLVLLGGNEEEATKDKKNIFYGMLGLVIILIANPIITQVFFKVDTDKFAGVEAVRPGIDMQRLIGEITGVTNLMTAIAGPLALLALMAGALLYALSGDNEERAGKAKKIILWALVGLVIIYGAFAIVSTFVARQFEGI